MKVAVLCEFSGVVRDAFRRRGHDAVSCDVLPSDAGEPHIQADCLTVDWSGYDLIVAHPPCTFLCNSGVRWLKTDPMRRAQMEAACGFFNAMLALPCPRIAVENPVPHGHAVARIGEYTQTIQPWQFGHGESKRTCLWLRGLPELKPTQIVEGRKGRVHGESPGPDRWKRRSVTYQGIADAMAEQWATASERSGG
jgi:hypothetical protein